jgi:sugar lactone lactonase YvrE
VKISFWLLAAISTTAVFAGCTRAPQQPRPWDRIETIAGSNGEFGEPFGIASKGGDVYVSDGETGKIMRIDAAGEVHEIGVVGHTPSGLTVSPGGELLVADSGTNTIRAIAADGATRSLAGSEALRGSADGPVGSATFNSPVGISAVGGDVVLTDTYNDRIRLIRNGQVTTLAGSERGFADGVEAKFDTPLGIVFHENRLLVADAGNRRIRVVELDGRVWTLAGNGDEEVRDGPGASAAFENPTAVTVSSTGRILVSDGDAIREISGLIDPQVTTVAGSWRGFVDGPLAEARLNRPSGLAFDQNGDLLVADSDNRVVRRITGNQKTAAPAGTPKPYTADEFRNLAQPRWPFDPPDEPRDVAGTLGEIRGNASAQRNSVWFHNGLDIAGAYGETTYFLRDEKVLDPIAADNYGSLRELLRMPTLGYIHLRLGRNSKNEPFDDARFQFSRELSGKIVDVRVPRGTTFRAGEPVGTLNAMNHVHLIAGRAGSEMNALAALAFPGAADTITPIIEAAVLFDEHWQPIESQSPGSRYELTGKTRLVVRAYDRMDGNAERRKLGVYKLGYQLLNADLSAAGDVNWTIEFDRNPPGRAVRYAYAPGSRSGSRGETIFNYIVTNTLKGDQFSEGFIDASALMPGTYVIRLLAADFFGNIASKDVAVELLR